MAAIGRVLLMDKGAYSGSTVYNQLDWVRDNGAAWVCKVDGTVGIAPPTLPTTSNANWTLMAADGSVSGSVEWTAVNNKPFDTVDTTDDFTVDGSKKLSIKRDTFGTMRIVSGGTTTNLEASGDSVFEIDAGSNVTITADDTANPKKITINSTGGGGGGGTWGSITGTLSDQTDLQNALNAKADDTDVHDSTITIQKNGTTVDTFTTNASANKSIDIPMDDWTGTYQTLDGTTAVFSNLNDAYGYDLYCENKLIGISNIAKTGSGTSTTLTYTVTGASIGDVFKLRILK